MQNAKQHLILNKGGERFIFRYDPGQEEALAEVLAEQAEDDRTGLDWIDAAVLQLKLAHTLAEPQTTTPPISPGNRLFPFRR